MEIEQLENPENAGEIRDDKGRFIKGVSGNPNGKPPGSISIVAKLREELQKCPEGEDKKTYLELLIKRILSKALVDKDTRMIIDIINRVDGMPKQTVDMDFGNKREIEEALDSINKLVKKEDVPQVDTKPIQSGRETPDYTPSI